jgi:hypothetical protein
LFWLRAALCAVMVSMTCPSVKASPCQRKCEARSSGAFGELRADDEPQVRLVQLGQVRPREHPGVGDHDHLGHLVPFGEGLDDRDDGRGLGPVAGEAADLEREALPVDEQPDDDLRVDAPLLGVADLAQVVLVIGLEVQRRGVIEH